MKNNITIKNGNRTCQVCGSSAIEDIMHAYYSLQAVGYYCYDCEKAYIFEEAKVLNIPDEDVKAYERRKRCHT